MWLGTEWLWTRSGELGGFGGKMRDGSGGFGMRCGWGWGVWDRAEVQSPLSLLCVGCVGWEGRTDSQAFTALALCHGHRCE